MGPINEDWIAEHGEHWAAGRIDISGLNEEEYWDGRAEYGLAPMHTTSWNALSEWLDTLETDVLLSFEELILGYQWATKREIRWWKDENE
jgi:hypothetical protein